MSKTYIGVLRGGKLAAIVCTADLFRGWSADLVFSVKQDSDKVPEMTLESFFKINSDRTVAVSRTISPSTLEASSDR